MKVVICRICSTKTRTYSSLLGTHYLFKKKFTLLEYIKKVTSVQLRITDNDLQNICATCIDKLRVSFEFIENVRQVGNYLSLINDASLEDPKDIDIKEENEDVHPLTCDVLFDNDDKHETDVSHVKVEDDKSAVKSEIGAVKLNKRCALCKKQFPLVLWKAHISTHQNTDGTYGCLDCDKQFNSFRSLIVHNGFVHKTRKTNSEEKERKSTQTRVCCVCNVEKGWTEMKTHILTHLSEDGTYDCARCGRVCNSYQSLQAHIRRIHKQNTSQIRVCCICQAKKRFTDMKSHILTHRDKFGNYECPKCGKIKFTYENLRSHVRGMHQNSEYVCPHCGDILPTINVYNSHIRKHILEKKEFKCEVCSKTLKRPSDLLYHVQSQHATEKTFVCTICGFKFWTQLKLNKHVRTYHQPDSQCKCEVCDKLFSHKYAMRRHLKKHSLPTKKCLYCNAMFFHAGPLKVHMSKHTGEKPLKCVFCCQSFVQHVSLKHHVIKHHPGEDYQKCLKSTIVKNNVNV